jgi:hypothetical protein
MRRWDMVTTEDDKKFHKRKTMDALDRMKEAVNNEEIESADHEQTTAGHHLEEMARLKSEEED